MRRAQTVCLAKGIFSLVKIVYCTVWKMVVVKIISFYHDEKIVGLKCVAFFWLSIKEEEEGGFISYLAYVEGFHVEQGCCCASAQNQT